MASKKRIRDCPQCVSTIDNFYQLCYNKIKNWHFDVDDRSCVVQDNIKILDSSYKPCFRSDYVDKKGDFLFYKGNEYVTVGDSIAYKALDGIFMYKTDCIFNEVDYQGRYSYLDDALIIYKVFSGKIEVIFEDGRKLLLKSGDIVNAAGNYKMKKFHSFGEKTIYIGVACYYKEMIEAIKNESLDNSFLEEFYYNKIIRNCFVHRGNYQINKLFSDLEYAYNNQNKLLIKAKTLELLSLSALYYKDFIKLENQDVREVNQILFNEIKDFLDNNLDKYYSMQSIADKFAISLSTLKNLFKEFCGLSPYAYHLNKRLEKSRMLLEETDYKITHIYKSLGFSCNSNFSKAFLKKYKVLPSQYRKQDDM